MVTIQERAVQQAQARVEAQPFTRTERKRIELARRRYIPPPPQAPAGEPPPQTPEEWRGEQQQEAQTKLSYWEQKYRIVRQEDDEERTQRFQSYIAHMKQFIYLTREGYSFRQVLGLVYRWTDYDLAKREARLSAQARAEEYQRQLQKEEPEEVGPTVPQPGDPGFIGPVRPQEGDPGFIGPVRPEYMTPELAMRHITPPTPVTFPSATRISREIDKSIKVDIVTQPTIRKEIVEVWKAPSGKEIPITQTYFIDPTKRGEWEKRIATPEEERYLKEQTSILIAGEVKAPPKVKVIATETLEDIKDISKTLNQQIKQITTDPTIGRLFKAIDYEPGKTDIGVTTEWLKKQGVPSVVAETGEVMAGAGLGILEDIYEKPLKQIALVGVGVGAGAIVGGVTRGTTVIASRVSASAGAIASKSIQYGLTGAGIYLGGTYALTTAERVALAETPAEKGAIIGVTAKDISLMGIGYAKGQKLYEQLAGKWATRGRVEVDIEKLVPKDVLSGKKAFPTAPKEKHLKIFKEAPAGKYLGEEPGIFHVAPEKFWKKAIEIKPGKAELPGLYGAPYISPHFAKVSPLGKYKLFGWDVLTGKPGVAYIKPKAFRIADWYEIPAKPTRPLGYEWKLPAKPGVADIPLMKTEIEAVLRAGSPALESAKYYTTIHGVRVPIDVFGFKGVVPSPIKPPPKISVKSLVKDILKPKEYVPSAYYVPVPSPIYTPSGVALSSMLSKINKNTSSILSKVGKTTSSVISKVSKTSSSVLKEQVKRRAVSEKSIMKDVNRSVSRALSKTYYKVPGIPYEYPPYRPPRKPPRMPPGVPPLFKPSKKELKKLLKKKLSPEYAYIPGFAGKISQKVIEVSERQAQQLLRQVQTGFEIRPLVRIVKKKRRKKK